MNLVPRASKHWNNEMGSTLSDECNNLACAMQQFMMIDHHENVNDQSASITTTTTTTTEREDLSSLSSCSPRPHNPDVGDSRQVVLESFGEHGGEGGETTTTSIAHLDNALDCFNTELLLKPASTSFFDDIFSTKMVHNDLCFSKPAGVSNFSLNVANNNNNNNNNDAGFTSQPTFVANFGDANEAWPKDYISSHILASVVKNVSNESRENRVEADSSYDSDHDEMNKLVDHLVDSGTSNSPEDEKENHFLAPGFSQFHALSLNHHDEVNRTSSETLAQEFTEYVTREMFISTERSSYDADFVPKFSQEELNDARVREEYNNKLDWTIKLGYSEQQFVSVINRLGVKARHNDILAWLLILNSDLTSEELDDALLDDFIDFDACDRAQAQDKSVIAPREDERAMAHALRPIVIDGSNVAMSHGNKQYFSCRGIEICVNWFRSRAHQDITVFVPMWRKQERTDHDYPLRDREILLRLEAEKIVRFTPSRNINGQNIVSHDDLYILQLASVNEGIIVSNDNYRDIVKDNPEFKKAVDERLLMFTFVNDIFMPPSDPLGRRAPKLDQFLTFGSNLYFTQRCPYDKRCTYGSKCKYYHPERTSLQQKSVAEMLQEKAKLSGKTSSSSNNNKIALGLQKSCPLNTTSLAAMKSADNTQILARTSLNRTKSNYLETIGDSCSEARLYNCAELFGGNKLQQKPSTGNKAQAHAKLGRTLALNPSETDQPRVQQANSSALLHAGALSAKPAKNLLSVAQAMPSTNKKLCHTLSFTQLEHSSQPSSSIRLNVAAAGEYARQANWLQPALREQVPLFKSLSSCAALGKAKDNGQALTRHATSLHASSSRRYQSPKNINHMAPGVRSAAPQLAQYLPAQQQAQYSHQHHQQRSGALAPPIIQMNATSVNLAQQSLSDGDNGSHYPRTLESLHHAGVRSKLSAPEIQFSPPEMKCRQPGLSYHHTAVRNVMSHNAKAGMVQHLYWPSQSSARGPCLSSGLQSSQSSMASVQHFQTERNQLFFHLSSLFPNDVVFKAMSDMPDELDSVKLCSLIFETMASQTQA